MTIISSAVAAKLLAPIAGAALTHVAKTGGSTFLSRNKLRLPPRKSIADMNAFLIQQIETDLGDGEFSEELMNYVRSPDCTTFVEHLICFMATGRDVRENGPLKREIETGIGRYAACDQAEVDSLFRVLIGSARFVLEKAGVTGHEDVHEKTQVTAEDRALEVYARSIDAQIELLTSPYRIDLVQIDGAIARYATAARTVIGKIQPPNFDGSEAVDTARLFVAPAIRLSSSAKQYTLADLVEGHRCVVLGDPGGGKTTLSRKLALDILDAKIPGAARAGRPVVPFLVVLRDFGAYLNKSPGSVAEFLSESLRTTYQTKLAAAEIEYLLTVGRAYVVFDGLDELLEPKDRRQVANIVSAFSATFTNAGILVTSRRVGYLQAPLHSDAFVALTLEGFDKDTARQYVVNWFSLVQDLPNERVAELVDNFMQESSAVPELQSSPLLLALMCTIYRFEGYIPRNRPDVYEKCSKMLFDRWDRHRGLREEFDFEAHIEPALMSLAYSIYLDTELQSGVTEAGLVRLASDYLDEWQYGNRAVAEQAASRFVAFCRGRAWVFSDVGLTPEGDSLYAFTHRTFLEFFAASHLTRTHATLEHLIEGLRDRICQNEWDVVAQLALQVKAKASQGGPDFAASSLVAIAAEEMTFSRRRNVAAFLSRCLAFFPLSPRCARDVGARLITITIESYIIELENTSVDPYTTSSELGSVLEGIRESAREVRNGLIGSVMDSLNEILNRTPGNRTESLWKEIAAGAAWSLHRQYNEDDPDAEERRLTLYESLLSAGHENKEEWGTWIAVALYWRKRISPLELIELIPIEAVQYSSRQIGIHALLQPLFSSLREVATTQFPVSPPTFRRAAELLGAYAAQIRDRWPLPSSSIEPAAIRSLYDQEFWQAGREVSSFQPNPVSDQLAVDFALVMAFIAEAQESEANMESMREIRGSLGSLSFVSDMIQARERDDIAPDETLGGLPGAVGTGLVEAWFRREIDLIADTADTYEIDAS